MRKSLFVYLATIFVGAPFSFQITNANPPPGSIKMLPGYKHEIASGIDTAMGRIWKDGGLTINYDIGFWAGEYATAKQIDAYSWYKEQSIDARIVRIALTKERKLIATFPDPETPANFFATIRTEQDLVDALLMILTYKRK